MTSHSNYYYEPNKPPEEVISKQSANRVIKFRFRNAADVAEFTRLTGIDVIHGKVNRVVYPQSSSLNDFF